MARILALAALIAAVALAALAMFGGSDPYRVKAVFQNAGQLVPGNEVRVGGQPIGSISDIELDDSANAIVTMEVGDAGGARCTRAPRPRSGRPRCRASRAATSRSSRARTTRDELEDGGRIGADETSSPVDLDTLFNTLDAKTRAGLRNVIRGSGTQYDSRGVEAGESIKYFGPFLGSTSRLTQELALDQQVLEQFVKDGADTVSAIASRRGDLTELVSNTNSAMRAIGDENVSLQRALELLPGTLRKANTTFVNLRNTLDDLDKLVNESKPNTKELAPFLKALRPLVHDARPTVADLRDLIRLPGPNNDLIELTAKQPRLAELTASVFPRAIRTLDRSDPVISYARPYIPDLSGVAHQVRPGGGVLRRERPLRARAAGVRRDEASTATSTSSIGVSPSDRLNSYGRDSRPDCPGGATQPTPDGSAPWAVNGCEPTATPDSEDPPGP